MYAKRVDANQKTLVKELRQAFVQVFHLHTVGRGCPDLLLGWSKQTHLCEIKVKRKKDGSWDLTEDQVKFHSEWCGTPIIIGTTAEEIVAQLIQNQKTY